MEIGQIFFPRVSARRALFKTHNKKLLFGYV